MKKGLILALVLSLVLVLGIATVIWAGIAGPGVWQTPHDVNVIYGQVGLEPCAMCHSPHSGTGQYPLWNREQAAQTYTMYASATADFLNPPSTPAAQPQEPSSLCLVCHNGVFSSAVNYPGPGSHENENYDYEMNPTFWAMLGTDLRDDHPISFTYDAAGILLDEAQDRNGFPPTIPCPSGGPRTFIQPNRCVGALGFGPGFPLYGSTYDQFECATCHSVHDTVSYPGKQMVGNKSVGTQVFFLRCDNSGSILCAECHQRRYDGGTAGW